MSLLLARPSQDVPSHCLIFSPKAGSFPGPSNPVKREIVLSSGVVIIASRPIGRGARALDGYRASPFRVRGLHPSTRTVRGLERARTHTRSSSTCLPRLPAPVLTVGF